MTVRSYLFSVYFVILALLVAILGAPTLLRRDWAMSVQRIFGESVTWGLRTICGISVRVEGAEQVPDGPVIIAAKHQSMWETFFLVHFLENPCFVMKKELLRIPIYGWWINRAGNISIDRDAGATALRAMVNDAREAIEGGARHLIIFPEGTRTPVGKNGEYQPGVAALARALNLPVVPTAHNSGCFWKHPGPKKNPGTIVLRFLPPLSPAANRKTLMADLEARVEETTRVLEEESRRTASSYHSSAASKHAHHGH